MYAAIDLVVDKLERQIRKHKTKVNRKLREKGSMKTNFILPEAVAVLDAVEEDELELVRTKRFDLKPMDVEEAILQMDMLDIISSSSQMLIQMKLMLYMAVKMGNMV